MDVSTRKHAGWKPADQWLFFVYFVSLFSYEEIPMSNDPALFKKERLIAILKEIAAEGDIFIFKNKVSELKTSIIAPDSNQDGENGNGLIASCESSDILNYRRDLLVAELDQILEAQTFERAKY